MPSLVKGQIVVMDNLRVHKTARVRQLPEEAGCELLFLPAYSPDFSPIEEMFSKVKSYLRQVGARTTDTVITAMGAALDRVTPSDIIGWFHDRCAYAVQ